MDILGADFYHIPKNCEECNGIMIYKGVGEYQCEKCGFVALDDYGKVRLFIEEHKRGNAAEIEAGTGVSQKAIRRMLRESRLEVTADSKMFMRCESCGKEIRSGRFCPECEMAFHRRMEEKQREQLRNDIQGYGKNDRLGEEGERRYMRRDSKR